MPQPFFGATQFPLDMRQIQTTNILEFDALEQIPNAFLWIEFRGIARQLFQMNAFGSSFSQVVFDFLTTMNRGSIPDHQQVPRNLAGEQLQKANDIGPFVGMVLGLHNELSFWRHGTHSRDMITRQLDAQGGRLAYGCIGAHGHRQEIKCRLIDEDYRAFFLFRLFFSAGQRSFFQATIPASSRCVAFWMGFCRLCLMRRRRREPCAR